MASEKTASVKLSLNSSSFVSAIKDVGKQTEKTTKGMESSFKKSMVAGLKSVQRASGEMMASVKSTIGLLGGLGGALSLGAAVKGAIDVRSEFKKLAFQAQAGSGAIVDWRDILGEAQAQAIKWGQATEELGDAFGKVRANTGDLRFAKDSLAAIAITARATGESVDLVATIAGNMNEKFGVTAKELPEALAVAFSLAQKGGVEFSEMANVIERAGSSAKFLGVTGVAGISKIIGMANLAEGETKNMRAALAGTMALMEQLGSAEGAKKVAQDFGVVIKKGQTFEQTLAKILKRTGGKESLLVKGFQGEQLKVVMELGKVYRAAFEGTSGTVEQKTKAATDAFQRHLDEAGKASIHAADIEVQAADKMKDPAAQMASAWEEVKKKFTSPEMLDGLTKIAAYAPKAAKTIASLMDLVFNSPALAIGIFAGIKLGAPFLEGAIKSGGESVAKSILSSMKGGAGAPGGVGGALGKGAAVLGAAAVGFAIGEMIVDAIDKYSVKPTQEHTASLAGATAAAAINTTGRIAPAAATASLAELRKRLDVAKEDREFHGSDIYTVGLRRLGTASSEDIAKGETTYARGRKALDEALAPSAEKAGDKLDDFATSLDGATRKIQDLLGGGGGGGPPSPGGAYRGPPKATPPGPGYAPRVNG